MSTQQITYNALVAFQLEKARKDKGIEQNVFCRQVGMSQPMLSRIETGKTQITVDQMFILCKALGIAPEVIMKRASEGVNVFDDEEYIEVTTTKKANNNQAATLLTGAAIGSILTLLLTKNK